MHGALSSRRPVALRGLRSAMLFHNVAILGVSPLHSAKRGFCCFPAHRACAVDPLPPPMLPARVLSQGQTTHAPPPPSGISEARPHCTQHRRFGWRLFRCIGMPPPPPPAPSSCTLSSCSPAHVPFRGLPPPFPLPCAVLFTSAQGVSTGQALQQTPADQAMSVLFVTPRRPRPVSLTLDGIMPNLSFDRDRKPAGPEPEVQNGVVTRPQDLAINCGFRHTNHAPLPRIVGFGGALTRAGAVAKNHQMQGGRKGESLIFCRSESQARVNKAFENRHLQPLFDADGADMRIGFGLLSV